MRQASPLCFILLLTALAACGDTRRSSGTGTADAVSCPALDSCHDAGNYDASTQQCTHPSKADGTPCAVATLCEGDRVCQDGVCADGEAVACPGTGGCNLAVCDPNTGCDVVTLTGSCEPGLPAVALSGCTSGDYAATVTLGGSQAFTMIVDSGSSTIAVAGDTCSNCNGISPLYAPGGTATDERLRATGAYGSASSWSGNIYADLLAVGADTNSTMTLAFVSIDEQSTASSDGSSTAFFSASFCSGSSMSNSFQGILGLAGSSLNAPHTSNYLDSLQNTQTVADAFSVQFCDAGGNLWFGGYNPNSVTAAPNYTPMDDSTGYYKVNLQDVRIGDASLGVPASAYGAAVVDTGTSVVVVNSDVMAALSSVADSSTAFRSYFAAGFLQGSTCEAPADRPTKAQLDAALPAMTWVFEHADGTTFEVVMPATESYLTPQVLQGGVVGYCSGFIDGGTSTQTIIGNSAMHSQIVIFDRTNAQLGFAPQAGCP